jgi:uncharacterized membrane protein YdjX (TVP38/TMEM64 family)
VISWLRSESRSGWAVPLFLGFFLVATTALTPAALSFITAGALWGFWPGFLIAFIGANLWSNVHFLIGRVLARAQVKEFLSRRGFSRVTAELEHGGVLATVVVRQLPLPFLVVNLAGGASPMRTPRWLLGNALGLLPTTIVYAQLGAAIASGVEGARTTALLRALAAGLLVIALGLVSRLAQRRRAARPSAP